MTSTFDVLHESALYTDEFGEGTSSYCMAWQSLRDGRRAD